MSHDNQWLKMLNEAQTDHDRAKAVFAFRKQVVENKTVEELRKALGVPAAASGGDTPLTGQCVLK